MQYVINAHAIEITTTTEKISINFPRHIASTNSKNVKNAASLPKKFDGMMIFSFLIVGLTIHLMNQLNVWNLLPLPLTGLHFIFVLAIITTILGVFISMFIFKHALNPITQLSRSMQQVAEGNYNVKLDADPHKGEIHDLLTNFNHMVQELNSTETLHSDFISSVSHEFKTPLATISGYATLLQDDTLSAEERNEYINIIIRTTRELSHMTGNILSLSRLENQTIITDQESFHVDEQIRQCILLRETIWSEKNLVIDPDLDSIIKERLNKASSMGFMADLKDKYDKEENILMKATVEDLKNFGMIPEFLGRLPILFSLEALDEDMLVRILKEPKNAIIKQYQKLLELDEVKLEFTDEALHAIAKQAKQRELGARALRAIIEEFMLDIMYEIPKDDNIGEVIITEDYVTKKGGPKIVMRGAEANLIEG